MIAALQTAPDQHPSTVFRQAGGGGFVDAGLETGFDAGSCHSVAKAKKAWLLTFLELTDGIPSHDTFGRVFGLINPEQFAACFRQWSAVVATLLPDEINAVDGKTLRRSHNRNNGLAALHLFGA